MYNLSGRRGDRKTSWNGLANKKTTYHTILIQLSRSSFFDCETCIPWTNGLVDNTHAMTLRTWVIGRARNESRHWWIALAQLINICWKILYWNQSSKDQLTANTDSHIWFNSFGLNLILGYSTWKTLNNNILHNFLSIITKCHSMKLFVLCHFLIYSNFLSLTFV